MNIKKIILLITIMVFSLLLVSCNSAKSMMHARENELNASNDNKIADTHFNKIMEALKNEDKEGLKKIFSPNALKEAKDIDGGIDYIMKFYKGNIKSKDVAHEVSEENEHGKKTKEIKVSYTVTTDKGTYIVFFIDKLVDTKNPDNIGLYMLQIIKESDKEKEFDGGGDKTRCAGIYRPDTLK